MCTYQNNGMHVHVFRISILAKITLHQNNWVFPPCLFSQNILNKLYLMEKIIPNVFLVLLDISVSISNSQQSYQQIKPSWRSYVRLVRQFMDSTFIIKQYLEFP